MRGTVGPRSGLISKGPIGIRQSHLSNGPPGSGNRGRGILSRGRRGTGGAMGRGRLPMSSLLERDIDPPEGYGDNADDEDDERGPILSQAIEEAIDFKEQRAKEIGVDLEDVAIPELEPLPLDSSRAVAGDLSSSSDEADSIANKADKVAKTKKNQKKKMKKKRSKIRKREQLVQLQVKAIEELQKRGGGADIKVNMYSKGRQLQPVVPPEPEGPKVDIEYVPDDNPIEASDPNYHYFAKIFEAFKLSDLTDVKEEPLEDVTDAAKPAETPKPVQLKDDLLEDDDDDDRRKASDDDPSKLSKKKWKLMTRPSIADLKASVNRPDVVEWHDVTARDPKLLVHLKATRNTVPVPRHWCFKRKYLAGKRGVEKPAFELPEFIKKTGIMEMRAALSEKEDQKTLKAKMREKVRPKLGKIDIDYQKLHDAFFRWQTKPYMSMIGNLYFEGRENETKMKDKKPGELSDDLRTALGMPLGPNAPKFPPPWLIAMQRYGPPPSYPNLKIPGLNAPIPEACAFGYHAGGWGKPPVDEHGKPLYGDVFALDSSVPAEAIPDDDVDRTPWGELESESEEESDSEDSEDEEGGQKDADADESGLVTPAEGLITPSGMSSSVTAGMETPDTIELRKKKIQQELEGGETPALFTVLPEKKIDRVAGAFMHSTHVYDINAAVPKKVGEQDTARPSDAGGVEVALNPEELDLADTAAMSAKYEEKLKEQQLGKDDDLSDMVAEHAARQKRKRKSQGDQKTQKNYKQFKF